MQGYGGAQVKDGVQNDLILTPSYVSEMAAAYRLLLRTLTSKMGILRIDSFMVGCMQLSW